MYWVNTMVQKLSFIEPKQKFVQAYFALIIIIVVHVVTINQYLINTCGWQESLAPENDAGFILF